MKIRSEHEVTKFLSVINSLVLVYASINLLFGNFGFFTTINFIIVVFLGFFKYRTLKRIHYTYWFLAVINLIYIFTYLFAFFDKNHILFQLILSTVFLLFEMYLISSPIFYPRASWWEYDFRYRPDIKVKIRIEDLNFDGRIADIRRDCISLLMFKKLSKNSNIEITSEKYDFVIHGTILTIKEPNPGRGYSYGVKLKISKDNLKVKQIFNERKKEIYKSRLNHEV